MVKEAKKTEEKGYNELISINLDDQLYDYINQRPMTEPILEMEGEEQKFKGMRKVTARIICYRVFFNMLEGEQNLTGDQKLELTAIALVLAREPELKFTVKELEKIRARVRKGAMPMILCQIDPIFEEALK